jgi:outer membrane protein assembly factor BamB
MIRVALFVAPLWAAGAGCEWFKRSAPDVVGWYVEQPGYSYAQPAVVGDTVYAATGDGQVIARDVNTRTVLWSKQLASGRIWGSNIIVAGGAVVVPVLFETHGLDAHSGELLWTFRAPIDTVDGGARNPGTVAKVRIAAIDSTVIIPAWGGSVTAVHARTGSVQWQWRPPNLAHRFGSQGVTVDAGTAYVGIWHFLDSFGNVSEGRVVALEARTGREEWHTVLPHKETVVCLSGRPAVTDWIVAVATLQGRVYGLDRATGEVRWTLQRDTPPAFDQFNSVLTGAVASNDTIYADAGTRHFRAISAKDGTVFWRMPYGGQFSRDMTLADSRIYAPDGAHLYVFDRATGRLVRTMMQPGGVSVSLFSASVAVDRKLVYAPVNGALWTFPH